MYKPSLLARARTWIAHAVGSVGLGPFKAQKAIEGKILGCDISQYQASISWARLVAAGYKFVFIRAIRQDGKADPMLSAHARNAKQAGIDYGLYVFWSPKRDPEVTARWLALLHRSSGATLPPAIDMEQLDGCPKQEAEILLARMLTELEKEGITPIIYTYPYFWPNWPMGYSKYPLWIAHYEVAQAKCPVPWTTWTFWQYAGDAGRVPGVMGPCDMDVFYGTAQDLQALKELCKSPNK